MTPSIPTDRHHRVKQSRFTDYGVNRSTITDLLESSIPHSQTYWVRHAYITDCEGWAVRTDKQTDKQTNRQTKDASGCVKIQRHCQSRFLKVCTGLGSNQGPYCFSLIFSHISPKPQRLLLSGVTSTGQCSDIPVMDTKINLLKMSRWQFCHRNQWPVVHRLAK